MKHAQRTEKYIRLIFNSCISDDVFFLKFMHIIDTNYFFSGDFQGQEGVRIMHQCVLCTIYFFSSSIKLQNINCVGFYWRFHMIFLLSGCCVMDLKSSTASVNISLNSSSERKYLGLHNTQDFAQILYFVGVVHIINRNNVFHSFPDREITCPPCFFVQNIKCVGFYWRFHMMFLLSGCCVMDSKSSTASVNISLNSGSERKLTQLIVHAHYRHELVFFWRFSRPREGAHYATLNTVL
jgi:hypothetical protein